MRKPERIWMAPGENYHFCFTMKAEGETAEVLVYSSLTSEKWWEKSPQVSTKEFDKALKDAKENGAKKLNIRINSPGGEVYAAVAMRSMVINNKFDSVRVMIEGLCASAATLFATIPGAHVVIAEGSEFMIHNPMTICWGNAAEMEEVADHLHKLEEQFHAMYAARTGKTEDQIREWMDKTTWFSPKEAIDNGFCDELLSTEKVAACASAEDLAMLKNMYPNVPDTITVGEKAFADGGIVDPAVLFSDHPEAGQEDILPLHRTMSAKEYLSSEFRFTFKPVSNGSPVAGEPTEINHEEEENPMSIEELTLDQLKEGNPALYDQVQQEAVEAERNRLSEIDDLTVPGYEGMAAEAKANGTSAMDFQKMIVKAMKEKGSQFMQARQEETAPAQEVAGGSPSDNAKTEEQEIQDFAKDVAGYASEYTSNGGNGMF